MVKVQLEDKDFAERKPYFGEGVHEVYITEARHVVPESGSPYVEVTVMGENDASDTIRKYTSEKAAPYTLSLLARIAVHNKDTEADKEKVRAAFMAIDDTDKLDDKFLSKLKDMQAWILVKEDPNAPKPNGGFYLRSELYSWEPQASKTTVDDIMPGGKPADASEVPFE